ncbi:hypothetical protein [Mycobacterium sp.]|jgi:hypothetical protein|uniref:hypothetical protein n=1 Tax=Mycobacterium sp. TaxID=1785 RepID=UPI003BB10320
MSRKYSTAIGLAAGAACAAFIGMGTAHADGPFPDPYTAPDPYAALFGAMGSQGVADNNLDLTASTESGYQTFQTTVDAFESTASEHGLENLVNAIDPSAFYEQTGGLDPGFAGTIADTMGAYLVPDSTLGYLATGLDFGLLTPTGLDFVLTPLIDLLTGVPVG